MRVAIYHNLPPGGALRALWEFVRRTSDVADYDLFTIDMGQADSFRYADARAERRDFEPYVRGHYRYPLFPRPITGISRRLLQFETLRRLSKMERQVSEDINRGGYDVVYVHPCQLTQSPGVLRHLVLPSLYYMQEVRRSSFEAGYWTPPKRTNVRSTVRWAVASLAELSLRRRDAFAVPAADRLACNSCYTAESIGRAYGLDAEVCYLGIDEETFSLTRAPHRAGRREVMSVGGLEQFKGHHHVVQALAALPLDERPILNLVYERCDDAYRSTIEALAASLGVTLRLHQGIEDSRLAELYGRSSATVLAARLEPFGLVALESLACGTPVVAVREGGYRETVVEGVNGYLVDRTPTALADGVRRVIRGELGASAEAVRGTVVPQWTWHSSIKRQLELLELTAREART